ncbi:hypothetical protein BJX68DRAFT_238640 [Aspergillus pseudodeflectus]|uniref:Uncharacterized protein n=1 Tax=Aspergillus pseudodeflectus TaxID=176178 RepID=A0ABR4KBT0_9EURO
MAELAPGIVALEPPVCAAFRTYLAPYKSFKGDIAEFQTNMAQMNPSWMRSRCYR